MPLAAACLFAYMLLPLHVIAYLALSVLANIWCFAGCKNLIACTFLSTISFMFNRYTIQCPQLPTFAYHSTRSSHILHVFQHTFCMITGHDELVMLNILICNTASTPIGSVLNSAMNANRYIHQPVISPVLPICPYDQYRLIISYASCPRRCL